MVASGSYGRVGSVRRAWTYDGTGKVVAVVRGIAQALTARLLRGRSRPKAIAEPARIMAAI